MKTPLPTRFSLVLDSIPEYSDFGPVAETAKLIVFSHLRWEFVTQRPQHIMKRLAQKYEVIFVEEALQDEVRRPVPHSYQPEEHITVVQPHQHTTEQNFITWLRRKVGSNTLPVLWFYSPAFVNLALQIPSQLIVYDCMDELAAFKGANQLLKTQEQQLMNLADIVFTGGKSLYASKKNQHQNVYCFPSSVDLSHFEKSFSAVTKVPADLARIAGPRVGFYGVIDERMDLQLLQKIAQASPKVSFVILGPVVKINPADLPQAPNVHYLGGKKYDQLPAYLKGFDITFMPFALNESTRFISPTKTLEFMAAHKAIISTPIRDVVSDYSQVAKICRNARQFAAAIEYYLQESATDKKHRVRMQKHILESTSWDKTVVAMSRLMEQIISEKRRSDSLDMETLPTSLTQTTAAQLLS